MLLHTAFCTLPAFAPLPLQLLHRAEVADNCSVCEVSTDFSILVLSILIKDKLHTT